MHCTNLINSVSPQEYLSWKRWLKSTRLMALLVGLLMVVYTSYQLYCLYGLRVTVAALHKEVDFSDAQQVQLLQECKKGYAKKLRTMKHWQESHWYSAHVSALAKFIASDIRIVALDFKKNRLHLKGQTQSLESLLGFVHALEQSTHFQLMNLTQLQPSEVVLEGYTLINFCLEGFCLTLIRE